MSTPVSLAPATWYDVTARDNNPNCRNFDTTWDINPFYSNDGIHYSVICGICDQQMEILTATLLDPQPQFS
jgi:hypothetical protein